MNFGQLKKTLSTDSEKQIRFRFANGGEIEAHCHVTEIGKVVKDFVDCGGTRRESVACVFQTFVANDVDHRVTVGTLNKIVKASGPLVMFDDLPVEVEYQVGGSHPTIGVYAVEEVQDSESEVAFILKSKATACLAPDLCGIDELAAKAQTVDAKSSTLPQLPGGC